MKKRHHIYHSCVIAPVPPPVGGIATIAEWLRENLPECEDVNFVSLIPKSDKNNKGRALKNLWAVLVGIKRTKRGGKVVCFSSASWSFCEKLVWAIFSRLIGRAPSLIMVDGNFIHWWSTRSTFMQRFVPFILRWFGISLIGQSEAWCTYFEQTFGLTDMKSIGATAHHDFFELAQKRIGKPAKGHDAQVHVLYIGWMIEAKGVEDLLLAFSRSQSNAVLHLVGPVIKNQKNWKDYADRLGLLDKTRFYGNITDRSKLLDLFLMADVFVLPSHAEGFSVALVEAVASGLPAIGSDVGGAKDTIIDGKSGIIVPPQSPNDLTEALNRLIDDPKLRQEMSHVAAEHALSQFSKRASLEKYCAILRT